MIDHSETLPTTICSAIVYNGRRLAIKDTGEGLSLLGGHVEWESGFPQCLQERVYVENRIRISPRYINGIAIHSTPSNKQVINVNVAGEVTDTEGQRGLYWMTLDEALRKEDEFRTLDVERLLLRTYDSNSISLDFIQPTMRRKNDRIDVEDIELEVANTEIVSQDHLFGIKDFAVVGAAVRYQEGDNVQYAFMKCGKEHFGDTLSLFGGKIDRNEGISDCLIRELAEETGGSLRLSPIGLVGLFINRVGHYEGQAANYAANFATVVRAKDKGIIIPDEIKEEVGEVYWIDSEDLPEVPQSMFRTQDTKRVPIRAESLIQQERILPLDFVEKIS